MPVNKAFQYPASTYRIQFHRDFTLRHLEDIIPYLHTLGVDTVYASPIFAAVPGSTHGYDGIDPHRINPEIGTEEDLKRCSRMLHQYGMQWLQDIVPNHMAFHTGNAWLMDVLRQGQTSRYAYYFDIDWQHPAHPGKLMVPFLGKPLAEELQEGNIVLGYEDGRFILQYFDNSYPLNDQSQQDLRDAASEKKQFAENALDAFNRDAAFLERIVRNQHYILCHWQETDRQINYRRFFTINGLICLNIQDPIVFRDYHRYIRELVQADIFQGLRIDHIDGLYNPAGYLQSLQEYMGAPIYTVVEKILQPGETLPQQWPAHGNTGYDFLGIVNQLLTDSHSERTITAYYEQLTGDIASVPGLIQEKKSAILYQHMAGELDNLYRLLAQKAQGAMAVPEVVMKRALGAVLIYCPVYRYYGQELPLQPQEAAAMQAVFDTIRQHEPELIPGIDFLEEIWITKPRPELAHTFRRTIQFSGPLTAKGVEDTLMYTYGRWIGHNDVGDAPEAFSISVDDFHRWMKQRQEQWPLSINTTSTHDTKRGEDARARLQAWSGMPDAWKQEMNAWIQAMQEAPSSAMKADVNDLYFLAQAIAANHPLPGVYEPDFAERLDAYIEKMLREGKQRSNWSNPDADYEATLKQAARRLLQAGGPVYQQKKIQEQIATAGIVHSLVQLLLKATCPGIPDIYQGTELWDLSMVDPDNRRPVDYTLRQQYIVEDASLADWQVPARADRLKMLLTQKLLLLRKEHKALFAEGLYQPLRTEGAYKDHVLAFARRYNRTWLVVVVPLHFPRLLDAQQVSASALDWKDTRVLLPEQAPCAYTSLLHPATAPAQAPNHQLSVAALWEDCPLALLQLEQVAYERGAGILLPVASLPGRYAIGDLGPEAFRFVQFLSQSQQRYWQLLPLNPTEAAAGNSPYSSYSALAGNPLLISPDLLVREGLLTETDIAELPVSQHPGSVDYEAATRQKETLLRRAFYRFTQGNFPALKLAFARYAVREAWWLEDVSLYVSIKKHLVGAPWHQWPASYKNREEDQLREFRLHHQEDILHYQWLQFVFERQWQQLRQYAAASGVQLFGDMPFYVSYDSADVWANQGLFCLDTEGRMTGMAGVPPDYFSEDGQLWGMPTFNWGALAAQGYDWWIKRLERNLDFFDLLRIDHFRALQDFWQVPAGSVNARKGEWLPGPRDAFFEAVRTRLGGLPFVAEDLGDEMEAVYDLRKRWALRGMKVLQFAWGENMPQSVDVPHHHEVNSIVYTGTHDNNTTIGWYAAETNRADHERMHQYLGLQVRATNIDVVLTRLAYASVANTAIIPMQDLLGLDTDSRMNTPGKGEGNWTWRMEASQLSPALAARLRHWVRLFGRG